MATNTARNPSRQYWVAIVLGLIWLAGLGLRVAGHDWDSGQRLHPDEILLMGPALKLAVPAQLAALLDPQTSPLNSHHFGDPYGTVSLYSARLVTLGLYSVTRDPYFNGYDGLLQTGRVVTALLDSFTILVVAALVARLLGGAAGLVAAALYALAILPIQMSHFFTMDAPLTLFLTLTLLMSLGLGQTGGWRWALGAGLALGLALACKLTAAPLAMLPVVVVAARWRHDGLRRTLARLTLLALGTTGALLLADPFALLDFQSYMQLGQLMLVQNASGDAPYTRRWVNAPPILYSWVELVELGVGPLVGLVATGGLIGWLVQALSARRLLQGLPLLGAGVYFTSIAFADGKWVRYLLPLVPYLCLFAVSGGLALARWPRWRAIGGAGRGWILGTLVLTAALGAWGFTAIYRRPDARVAASQWIATQIPAGRTIGTETWELPLPLPMLTNPPDRYHLVSLDIQADLPSAQAAATLHNYLNQVDYVAIGGLRNTVMIPQLPWRYPVQARYYKLLFAGQLGFHLVYQDEAHPALFGWSFTDETAWLDSSFIEYDHPPVWIFQRDRRLSDREWNRLFAPAVAQPATPSRSAPPGQ